MDYKKKRSIAEDLDRTPNEVCVRVHACVNVSL